ncbi:MAG: hypothetical protein WD802_04440 [Gemmatimonadaceae bacterium]
MDNRISLAGKIAVGLISTAAALVVIMQSCSEPKGKLRGHFIASQHEALPIIQSHQGKETVVKQSSPFILRPAPDSLIVTDHEAAAYLGGRVQNEGSKELKQVALRFPAAAAACVKRESVEWKCQGPSSMIALGDFAPLEAAVVRIWLREPLLLRSTYDAVKLVHSEGVGKIAYDTVTTPFGFVRRHGMWFFFGTMGALLLIVGLISEKIERAFARGMARGKQLEREEAEQREAQLESETRIIPSD